MTEKHPQALASGRYSINQTCGMLGICRDSLYKYTHVTGDIRCEYRRVGNKRVKYYPGSEINRFWENNTTD